ncbi:Rab-like protein 6 [Mortierella claussenii]|nr:Rab-like protein 6 [Mortierella claussenii]
MAVPAVPQLHKALSVPQVQHKKGPLSAAAGSLLFFSRHSTTSFIDTLRAMFKLWPFNSTSQQNGASQATEPQDHGVSTKVKPIHASFNKGVPLNMKIIIRGDIRTGKTCVFERLQGLPFRNEHEYKTTEQIQVANIPWQYPHTMDIIKVEVWDVVDKGVQSGVLKTSSNGNTLKIDNNAPTSLTRSRPAQDESVPHATFSLDASTIDVYRNTDGVLLVYDISKPWTFDYAAKTLAEIPINMPVLILSNFSDDSYPRPVIASDRVEALIREHNETRRKHPCAPANLVRHLDTSMKTGLGLKEVHEGFGIPFLNVLRETHRKQFEQKTQEINELLHTLDGHAQERIKQIALASQMLSPKDVTSPRKPPPMPTSIQTTGPFIHPIPQNSSPMSPARKTRNEHTNVDILSPTPVSAQTPAVLFDFNSGKLEEEFFQTIDLDSSATSASKAEDKDVLLGSLNPTTEKADFDTDGNPMVAADEDIGDSSADELADPTSLQTCAPVKSLDEVDKELMSQHTVKGAEEIRLEEMQDTYNDDSYLKLEGKPRQYRQPDEDDLQTDMESMPSHHATQRDSMESEFAPVASAMYYGYEPPAFAQEPNGTTSEPAAHSSYEEIVGGHVDNPWESTGCLVSGLPSEDVVNGVENKDESESVPDKDRQVASLAPKHTAVAEDDVSQETTMKVKADPALVKDTEEDEEPTSVLTVSTADAARDAKDAKGDEEEEEEEEDELSPTTPASTTPTEDAQESGKKKKKRSKKKGKKGK